MSRFTVGVQVVGLPKIIKKLNKAGLNANLEIAKELYREAEEIMGLSKERFVPVDEGHLRSSGHVQLPKINPKGSSVTMGYGGSAVNYAIVQHEVMTYKHTVGGPKYLERPLLAKVPGMGRRIAAGLHYRLKVKIASG